MWFALRGGCSKARCSFRCGTRKPLARATRILAESLTVIPRPPLPLWERTQNLWLGGAFATAKPLDFAGEGDFPLPEKFFGYASNFSTLPRGEGGISCIRQNARRLAFLDFPEELFPSLGKFLVSEL